MSDEVNNYEDWDINDFADGKTMAILSYLSICCCISIIPWFMAISKKDNDFLTFHARQGMGLFLISFAFGIVANIITMVLSAVSPTLAMIASAVLSLPGLACLVLSLIGVLNAMKEEFKPVPLVGDMLVEKMSFIGRKEA